jgi:polar amino acid transport system substrate-binding protein
MTTSTTDRRAFLATLVAALAGERANAQASSLTISTNNTPLDRRALEELTREALRRLGMSVTVVGMPSERSLFAANQGETDGEGLRVAGLSATYPDLIQVPERYIGISFVAFSSKPGIRLDQGWASLAPYSVAFINGWKMFEANATGARSVNKVEKPEQLFRMVEAGRVDLALYTLADGQALVRQMGLDQTIKPIEPALKKVDMFLYLHRRHEALVPRVAQALRDMKSDGSHERILANLKAH